MISNQNNATKRASSFEKETHYSCLSCSEIIHNPLCHECIAKEYFEWIKRIPKNEFDKSFNLRRSLKLFLEKHSMLEKNSLRCVSCNEPRTNLCPYCFTEILHKMTKEAGAGVKILSEFLFMFNFDFDHKGYFHELECYGGY
ncbi:hypothetical protein HN876_03335 [archaeon]|jgi:hypothetical protein|nr:hypothetical protein [archaeon]MBT6182332.1 hypothetical protein [archaeon]MBT6606678.1 hypothetical protein [archaeon]MBT7251921.1 hypothetical protein [archaeon]